VARAGVEKGFEASLRITNISEHWACFKVKTTKVRAGGRGCAGVEGREGAGRGRAREVRARVGRAQPERYVVRPNQGLLKAGQSVDTRSTCAEGSGRGVARREGANRR
jgi:hypothetical protein